MSSLRGGIAIIGMAGRFPGAADIGQFWSNLRGGRESIRWFDELEPGPLMDPPYAGAPLIRAAGLLDGIEDFDADFFGIPAREARILDPQHRLFMECAWEALEDAGHRVHEETIGVFAGCGANTYLFNLLSAQESLRGLDPRSLLIANEKDYLATRVSHRFGLTGPAVTVQTACSTSLVAVHLAVQSLMSGECDLALAGGVALRVPQRSGYFYVPESIESPDGRCRAFDRDARGTVAGSGVGVVVLRRYEDAFRGRDHVRAVVRGTAINNDGSFKANFTAPSASGQAAVIAEALAIAGLSPKDIGYVEAHGTGTPLGDAVEVTALAEVFGELRSTPASCVLGSVKTNIGHLDAAAGVAGLIKTVLALEHKEIPATLHFNSPNPELNLPATPFRVSSRLESWLERGQPRRAGVSSFGIGGTNAHVVLEEAAPAAEQSSPQVWNVLPVSARSPHALRQACLRLADCLDAGDAPCLGDAAFTLQQGRAEFPFRRSVVCADREQAVRSLARDGGCAESKRNRPVVFWFPDTGGYNGMGRELAKARSVFAQSLTLCHEIAAGQLMNPRVQLFCFEHALAQLWISLGVRPAALAGHGAGDLAARCIAGELDIRDAIPVCAAEPTGVDPQPAIVSPQLADSITVIVGPGVPSGDWGDGVASLQDAASGPENFQLLAALGKLWEHGVAVDWAPLHLGLHPHRVPLPAYPFERRRFWIDYVAPSRQISQGSEEPDTATSESPAGLENALISIWAEVLGETGIGVSDSFFDHNGDSLVATQILSRIRERFTCEITMRDFFERPTVESLANHIRAKGKQVPAVSLPPILPLPEEQRRAASFAQQRLWFLDQLEPGNPAYNIVLAIRATGILDVDALARGISEILRRHDVLRTTFAAVDGIPVPVISPPQPGIVELRDMTDLPETRRESELREACSADALRAFDLRRGPLMRFQLCRLSPGQHVLIIAVHHAVFDVWSSAIFFRELASLYQAFRGGSESPLPPVAVQYADFAVWQRQLYASGGMEADAAYWIDKLGGNLRRPIVPLDFSPPSKRSWAGAAERRTIPQELTYAIREQAARSGASPFVVLVTAYCAALCTRIRGHEIVLGTDIANRNHETTEGMIGFFVNQLVLRIDFGVDPTVLEMIRCVRETAFDAFAHQNLPFDRLVDRLNPRRVSGEWPLFGVKFVMRNVPMPKVDIDGLVFEPIPMATYATTFDFVLTAVEEGASIALELDFSTELYSAQTIRDFLTDYVTALELMTSGRDLRLTDLEQRLGEATELRRTERNSIADRDRTSSILGARRRTIAITAQGGSTEDE